MTPSSPIQKAKALFRKHGPLLRTAEAIHLGIHTRTLYAMRDSGAIEQVSRGLYRLAGLSPLGNPDIVLVARKVPKAVICLISALSFHEITTQVPHEIHIAVAQKAKRPTLRYPPLGVFWFSGPAFTEGVETHMIDGVPVRIYSPEKSVADCFKHRHKVGQDVAVEALRLCHQRKRSRIDKLLHFARICRVEKVMRPYLEAMI
jgi:predicted transcriptional regulator of viral defense system